MSNMDINYWNVDKCYCWYIRTLAHTMIQSVIPIMMRGAPYVIGRYKLVNVDYTHFSLNVLN